jgi:iron complex transport system permease protein
MRVGATATAYSTALFAGLLATIAGAATVGPVSIPYPTVAKALLNATPVPVGLALQDGLGLELAHPFQFQVSQTNQLIVVGVRAPRIVLAAVVGFALAAAGTVMQGFFRNPMADPSIVGVSSGAALGAVAAITAPGIVVAVTEPLGLSAGVGIQTAAFVGAIVAAFLVYAIATEGGRTPVATLLLAGIAVQTFLGAAVSYLLVQSGQSINRAIYWLMGDLNNAAWSDVKLALPLVLVLFATLVPFARDLNVLLLGEEDARTLGIEVERTKRVLLALGSIVTAAAVAVAGVIGFVGLVVPHVLRLVVGPDHRVLLPTSALAGGIFLVATDTLARSTAASLPVGVVTAAVGAPFFLFLLRRREVHEL